ncbi:MAG: hypothetical protein J7J91_08180 [Deltaproteobacteria bacterium]|nr:hypothetical protein [Deltaproteobacteria bacterium]
MAEEVGARGSEIHYTLLADFYYDHDTEGDLAAGSKWEPSAKQLETNQCAEITHFVIYPPTSGGAGLDLLYVFPVIDGAGIEEYVLFPGRYEWNIQPFTRNIIGGEPLKLGVPGEKMLLNTTLKAIDSIGIRAFAGSSAVTASFRIQVYGVLYNGDEALRSVYGDRVYGEGASEELYDAARNVALTVTKPEIEVSIKNFDMFVGGVRQQKPIVMPFVRFARNKNATTQNEEYEFDARAGEAEKWENLFFNYDNREALFIRHLGVRTVDHLKYLGVKIGDRVYPKPNMFRVDTMNIMNFGLAYPYLASDIPLFHPLPRLERGYLIHNIKGRVVVQDDGTSVSANSIVVATAGIRVSL